MSCATSCTGACGSTEEPRADRPRLTRHVFIQLAATGEADNQRSPDRAEEIRSMTKFVRPLSSPASTAAPSSPDRAVRSSDTYVRPPDNLSEDTHVGPDILIRISAPRSRAPAPDGGELNPPVRASGLCATGSRPTSVTAAAPNVEVRTRGAFSYDPHALESIVGAWASSQRASESRRATNAGASTTRVNHAHDTRRDSASRPGAATPRVGSNELRAPSSETRFASVPRRAAAARALGTITSARPSRGTLALEEKVKC
jgi:hypothetical protein